MSAGTINKTMDRDDLHRPECQTVLLELFALMRRMQRRGAYYSSWYGRLNSWPSVWEHINRADGYEAWPENPDEIRVPWFLLWEIAWLVVNTPLKLGGRILDLGGAGSLFSCYLASRGHEVVTIDLQPDLCSQAEATAAKMGWRVRGRVMDMTKLDFPAGHFEHVFSVCVFEHLPISGRIQCNEQVARVLRPGGTAGYTFDYANPQSFGRIDTPADVERQFVAPSGLAVRGNSVFADGGKRYLQSPQCFGFGRFTRTMASLHSMATGTVAPVRLMQGNTSYTMGAVFLEKADPMA